MAPASPCRIGGRCLRRDRFPRSRSEAAPKRNPADALGRCNGRQPCRYLARLLDRDWADLTQLSVAALHRVERFVRQDLGCDSNELQATDSRHWKGATRRSHSEKQQGQDERRLCADSAGGCRFAAEWYGVAGCELDWRL